MESGSLGDSSARGVTVGSYRLASVRSRNAECEVWNAWHMPTEMEVVMEIYPKSGDDKRLVELVVRKIGLFVDLAGKKVLRLLEVIDVDEAIFLVYENYSQQSMLQYAVNCPPSGREFGRLIRSLIKIVQNLHRKCFFHGTLVADSFVLTPQKKVKFKDAPSCNTFLRSRDEPARFDAILSKASDVWSIGTLIYRLIYHQLSSGGEMLVSDSSAPEAVPEIVAQMDPDLSDLLTRMTDQNPAARISTIECLRHPYLTRSEPTLLLAVLRGGDRDDRRNVTINLDIVRFLAHATGAPEAELAASAAANDLSSWCAAYWLLKQRLAAGRGYPPLNDDNYVEPDTGNFTKTPRNSIAPAVEPAAVEDSKLTMSMKSTKSLRKSESAGFRGKIALLRSRRLGLAASPRDAAADKSDTVTSMASTSARVRLLNLQHQPKQMESLPPISVRSAGQSDLTTHSSGHQQLTAKKQTQSLTSRYLSYLRRQELAATAAAAAASAASKTDAELNPPNNRRPQSPQSRATSDTIRVKVVRHRQRAGGPAKPDNPPTTLPTLSPRQPPNSRNELARQHLADSQLDVGDDEDESESASRQAMETQYLWENALVRWPEWTKTRVV